MKLKTFVIIAVFFLIASMTIVTQLRSTNTSRDYDTSQDWRKRWNINLSITQGEERQEIPAEITVAIKNQGDIEIIGGNLVLNFYIEDNFYGWGIDPNFRFLEEHLRLSPDEKVSKKIILKDLEFSGPNGAPLKFLEISKALKGTNWTIQVSLSDIGSVKNKYESSTLVWSNRLELHKGN